MNKQTPNSAMPEGFYTRYSVVPNNFPAPWASAFGEDEYGYWMAWEYQGVVQKFRWIHPGEFWMGSPEQEEGRYEDEGRHPVVVSKGFWLADTAVTQALWQAVTGNNPSHFHGASLPVEGINWSDCHDFLVKLRALDAGFPARLPCEHEWEYACRAGTQTAFSFGDKLSTEQANYSGNWDKIGWAGGTVDVKSFSANPWGLYQMHGNIWELCLSGTGDGQSLTPEAATDEITVDAVRPSMAMRGGSWSGKGRSLRAAYSGGVSPADRGRVMGLRLCLDD